jgi:hypothetical protein
VFWDCEGLREEEEKKKDADPTATAREPKKK